MLRLAHSMCVILKYLLHVTCNDFYILLYDFYITCMYDASDIACALYTSIS